MTEFVDFDAIPLRATPEAVLLRGLKDWNSEHWIPRSAIEDRGRGSDKALQDTTRLHAIDVSIAEWLAQKENLL